MPSEFDDVYQVLNKRTGEVVDMRLFVERVGKDKWEKAFAKTLAEYIGAGGSVSCKILAYFIEMRNPQNLILGTQQEIADSLGVSRKAVYNMIKKLRDRGFLKEVRSGCYFLSPEIISYGNRIHGAALLRIWEGI